MIGLGGKKRAGGSESKESGDLGGLDYGISAWHLRRLCEPEWKGGGGYDPQTVGRMSPGQIYFRLLPMEGMRKVHGHRVSKVSGLASSQFVRPDGTVMGRTASGKSVAKRVAVDGKSLAQRLSERSQAEKRRGGRRGT